MTEGSTMAATMIVRFGTHFGIRLGEWFASIVLCSLAYLFFTQDDMFSRNAAYFEGLRYWGSERGWGWIFFLFGSVRIVALWVNGRKPITPYIRMTLAFFSCFAWFQLTLSLFASGVPGLAWAMLPHFLLLEMYNVFRSSADAREVFDKRRAARNGNGEA